MLTIKKLQEKYKNITNHYTDQKYDDENVSKIIKEARTQLINHILF